MFVHLENRFPLESGNQDSRLALAIDDNKVLGMAYGWTNHYRDRLVYGNSKNNLAQMHKNG